MKQIKIGIVGTSFGATFIPLFRGASECPRWRLRNCCPSDYRYPQDLYGAMETFQTLDEMLASDVDAVCIFTQRWMHAAQAIQAMKAGKHVYSAVPAAITVEDMGALIDTAKKDPDKCICSVKPVTIILRQSTAAKNWRAASLGRLCMPRASTCMICLTDSMRRTCGQMGMRGKNLPVFRRCSMPHTALP